MRVKSFYDFLSWKINESEEPVIFKGILKDPYQYMIKGDRTYYAKKSEGDLTSDSQSWIEQTTTRGKGAIKDLYNKISVPKTSLDQETTLKIIELQATLNKVKPVMPKLWTLPLAEDGIPGWKTAWSWYIVMIIYPQMGGNNPGINDSVWYTKEDFNGFKNPENWDIDIQTALDFFEKYMLVDRWTKEGKIDFEMILKDTQDVVDFMTGKLTPGSSVNYLYCTEITKTIPESIKAEMVIIEPDCTLKTLPKSLECKYLAVYRSSSVPFSVPLIKTNNVLISGPGNLQEGWTQIDYLTIDDDYYQETSASESPIPNSLKEIGELIIESESITKIPDDLKIGEIMENYFVDPVAPDPVINNIMPKELEKTVTVRMEKKPWLKRIFSKEKYYYYYESNNSIREGFTGDPGDLNISGCINIKTLPKGLSVLGDFIIERSGIEFAFTDEEIRQVCDIKGNIVRTTIQTPEEEVI